MKPIYIFRHIDCEGPGYLAELLEARGFPYRVVAVDQGEDIPASPREAGGLVFMGGPMSANDRLPWIADELHLIRMAADAGIPVLGHCLGGQLISKALGADVHANPVPEIGWHPVTVIESVGAEPWLRGLPNEFEAFHWHGETFTLPDSATPVLRSEFCAHQAYVLGNVLALQCHVEMTAEMVREWAERYREELVSPSPSVQDPQAMQVRLDERLAALQQAAEVLYDVWLAKLTER
jgi:GMP synthase-like glutamine amidotransferase